MKPAPKRTALVEAAVAAAAAGAGVGSEGDWPGDDDSYDHGCLYAEPDGIWRVIGPTAEGPKGATGGEVVMWVSKDEGKTWSGTSITPNTDGNHCYVRNVVDAHPDFYAFWADQSSKTGRSRLYFADRQGGVRQLPNDMEAETARPVLIHAARRIP